MARYRLDSLSDFARQGYYLRITCLKCSRVIEANPALMMQRLLNGKQFPKSIGALEKRMKCSACGHRGSEIRPCDPNF